MHAATQRSATAYERDVDDRSRGARVNSVAGTSRGVRQAAGAVVALHLLLLAACQWIVFTQFQQRMPGAFHNALAAEFAMTTGRLLAIETVALLLSGLAAITVLNASNSRRHTGRVAVLLLLSYIPIALYTCGVLVALALRWEVDA